MSIPYSIFPGLQPTQSFTAPVLPVRSPMWTWKQTAKWSNKRQTATNGRTVVIKYWVNPLWSWEFTYGYIKDNPADSNPYYTVPIPSTDFEILKAFYNGMAGGGDEWAYQPPDSVRGGSFTITSAQAPVSGEAIVGISNLGLPGQIRLGDGWHISGLSTATYLNGENGTVTAINRAANLVTLAISTGGTHALVSDSGTAVGGQPLLAADANNNVELTNTIGSYPTTISATPTTTLVGESVQLIDTSTLTVYANGSSVSYTLNQPDTIPPYQGYVMSFSSAPATPITATFTYYYLCRFAQDMQEWENFLTMLWAAKSVKFDQMRI
jgi:hypothetical protein